MPGTDFSLRAVRVVFRAQDALYFPEGKAGNVFRSALGESLRRIACNPDCHDAKSCPMRATCPYARLFEPNMPGWGPSGLADWPRPFVLRAAHLDGMRIPRGDEFHLDLHLFDLQDAALFYLVIALEQMAQEGMGPGRGKALLHAVYTLDVDGNPSANSTPVTLANLPKPLVLSLEPYPEPVSRVRILFLTPTEIKGEGRIVKEPLFRVLFARIRDRLSTLRELYGEGPLAIDFVGMFQRSQLVEMTSSRIEWRSFERRSGRTGQTHPLSGFVGEAEYTGQLAEFLPFLAAAYWTGAGKQTVWGKGAIKVGGWDFGDRD